MDTIASELFLNIVSAIIIFAIGWWLSKYIQKLVVRIMNNKNVDPLLTSFTSNIVYIALIAFVIIAALGQLGIQTTSFIAIIGAAGLAIGLSLQSSLSNFSGLSKSVILSKLVVSVAWLRVSRYFPHKCELVITSQ